MALIHQAYIKKKGPATWCYQFHINCKPTTEFMISQKLIFSTVNCSIHSRNKTEKAFSSLWCALNENFLQVLDNLTSSWRLPLDFLTTTWPMPDYFFLLWSTTWSWLFLNYRKTKNTKLRAMRLITALFSLKILLALVKLHFALYVQYCPEILSAPSINKVLPERAKSNDLH